MATLMLQCMGQNDAALEVHIDIEGLLITVGEADQ